MLARVTTLNGNTPNTTQTRTYLTDALGSVMAQTQDNQSTLAGYSYSPYGNTQSTGNTEGDSVQYTARENDANGLYYYRARYYDPVLKRFISEDPIGLQGGSLSFYAYVNGNPVSYVDPEGLSAFSPLPNIPSPDVGDITCGENERCPNFCRKIRKHWVEILVCLVCYFDDKRPPPPSPKPPHREAPKPTVPKKE